MAKLEFLAPITAVHGKLLSAGVKVFGRNIMGFGAAMRSKANAEGGRDGYTTYYGPRDLKAHPYTEDETAAKTQFKAIQALVAARQTNAQKRVQDQAAFEAQTAKKTLKEYLWSICKAEYLASLSED